MNTRQRFLETLRNGHPDRFPYLDHSIRKDVLAVWERQGLPRGVDVRERFGLERWDIVGAHCDVEVDLRAIPPFEGHLRTRSDWNRLKQCFDPTSPGRYPPGWTQHVEEWRDRDYPLGLIVWRGIFLPLQVGEWDSLTDLLYLLHDDPVLVEGMMATIADFNLAVIDCALV
jgi:hypothetical protein